MSSRMVFSNFIKRILLSLLPYIYPYLLDVVEQIMLKLKLRLPHLSDYVVLKVQVINSKELAKNLMYETRVSFTEIDQKVKEGIRKLVDYA